MLTPFLGESVHFAAFAALGVLALRLLLFWGLGISRGRQTVQKKSV